MPPTALLAPQGRRDRHAAQRDRALQRANHVRSERAEVKRKLRDGAIAFTAAIDHWSVQTMPVVQLLDAQRQWGAIRSAKLLRQLRIPPSRTVRSLSSTERSALAAAVSQTT